jgi:hypothetical protein
MEPSSCNVQTSRRKAARGTQNVYLFASFEAYKNMLLFTYKEQTD